MTSRPVLQWLLALFVAALLVAPAWASLGDRLPDFKECVAVCIEENCQDGNSVLRELCPFATMVMSILTSVVALHLRLLLWTCPQNCDYICQHIITDKRVNREPPMLEPVVQYHGKWPFYRVMGMQEPFSVLFSFMNFMAHRWGQQQIRSSIPHSYPLRKWYIWFGYFGYASWIFSMIFHTRDFNLTEKLDYFAAGANIFYGLYYTPVRIFRLDQNEPVKRSLLRIWTMLCCLLYTAHVSYLTFWKWDYTYNMVANVIAGIISNIMWCGFSLHTYSRLKKMWAAWPGMIVSWIILAMSLELLDFPPIRGHVDAHSLWHLGTVGPTIWWYSYLVKDAQQDMAGERLKQ